MIHFECDYLEGCAPEILVRFSQTNLEQTAGYGLDPYCEEAREMILQECQLPTTPPSKEWRKNETSGIVHFLVGGTQTNALVIRSLLRPHQGVLAAVSGHINVHETGAIEQSGHKVLTLPTVDGKISAAQIQDAILSHLYDPNIEHVVQPGMVYLSYPTETGLLYSKEELTSIHLICRQYNLPLYIDGARIGYGLTSPASDMTLKEIAQLADLFYIGGTKQGALFGEALVIVNPAYRKDFRYLLKQSGGMLAKGRLLGIQFSTLFTNGLYWQMAKKANNQAQQLKEAFREKGYSLAVDSPTNQQFVVIPNDVLDRLSESFQFSVVERMENNCTLIRICTSWATSDENVEALIRAI